MELDRIVPNNIMSGGPEDLNLIELLWKQDVDLGVGKEVYDQNLREELERQKEVEYYKQQEKLKAQVAAREKEEKSKQQEASRWLNQNFMRDGETGEWVKRQNKTATNNGTVGTSAVEDANDDDLTLEAALDYIFSNVGSDDFVSNPEEADSLVDNLPPFQSEVVTNVQQTILPADNIQQLSVDNLLSPDSLLSSENLENEWTQVEEYLNLSLSTTQDLSALPNASLAGSTGQDYDITQLEYKDTANVMIAVDTDESHSLFTSADLPLLQDAALPTAETEPVPELGAVTLTNTSMPPQPVAMNTSMGWELENMSFFDNLTVLPQDNVDDIDLQNMADLFNTMTEASDLFNATNTTDIDRLIMNAPLNDSSAPIPSTSFTDELNGGFDGLEGATGGTDFNAQDGLDGPYRKISRLSESSSSDSGFSGKGSLGSSSSSSSSSYAGSPADSTMGNNSINSNDTEHDPHGTRALARQVAHNHTYNTLPGHIPREVKKYAAKESSKKGPQCRDERRAKELKIPFSIDQIVESPVETFNDILTKYNLNEEQLTLVRDIRRRGKNKLAAQNCRKRKVGVIVNLSDEMTDLEKLRDRLKVERAQMERETRKMKEKFGYLYTDIFQSLRDDQGQPYDPNMYSLQQSSDGNVFLVPRNVSTNGVAGETNTTTSNGHNGSEVSRLKKRKSDN